MSKNRITLSGGASLAAGGVTVDADAGIIRNVSICTAGPALGHGFYIDSVMLEQVAEAVNASKSGIRSRLTHCDWLSGRDGAEVMVGRVRNARVEGTQARGDVHIAEYAAKSPHGDLRGYLLGIAQEDPEAIGLSISYEPAESEQGEAGEEIGRLKKLHYVDFVGEPAANPSGLLSTPQDGGDRKERSMAVDMPDLTPIENESEADFVGRFVADPGMTEKYADGEERVAKAKAIYAAAHEGEEEQAIEPTPAPEAEQEIEPTPNPEMAEKHVDAETVLAADRTRRAEILALAKTQGINTAWAQGLADRGVSVAQAKELMELAMENKPVETADLKVGADRDKDTLCAGITDAMLLRAGRKVEKPHDRAREFSGKSMLEMGRDFLIKWGVDTTGLTRMEIASMLMSRAKFARAAGNVSLALGTSDFPYILANVANKSLRQAYELAPVTWSRCFRPATAPDFKQISRVQLGNTPALAAMSEGGEYTYGTIGEDREVYTLAKYGKGVKLTREMLINDDLSAFNRVLPMMGMMARYLEDDVAWAIITANAALADTVALFHSTHANTGTGAIAVAGLSSGRAAMRKQKAKDAATFLNIAAKFLIVPAALETTAEQFIASVVDPAKSNAVPNPFANSLEVVAEPRLDATSTAYWYLAADPSIWDTVEVCFLEGEPAPVVEEEEEFDTDCRKYKVRHQVAAKAIDYRGLYRSTGV